MSLFHQGGVSDDVSLTAYITAALLELDAVSPSLAGTQVLTHLTSVFNSVQFMLLKVSILSLGLFATQKDPLVSGCLQCLSSAVSGQLDNMYTMALLSYTFTLAGDQQTRTKLLTSLHKQSSTDGMDQSHAWNKCNSRTPRDPWYTSDILAVFLLESLLFDSHIVRRSFFFSIFIFFYFFIFSHFLFFMWLIKFQCELVTVLN